MVSAPVPTAVSDGAAEDDDPDGAAEDDDPLTPSVAPAVSEADRQFEASLNAAYQDATYGLPQGAVPTVAPIIASSDQGASTRHVEDALIAPVQSPEVIKALQPSES